MEKVYKAAKKNDSKALGIYYKVLAKYDYVDILSENMIKDLNIPSDLITYVNQFLEDDYDRC